ncbi:hypothetical protein GGU11DRAFT_811824 [Lentinula aff. detonsa]|nr:hypothetical protein GGU11DRAFT_811824 [Lentinula aff. detonsa]
MPCDDHGQRLQVATMMTTPRDDSDNLTTTFRDDNSQEPSAWLSILALFGTLGTVFSPVATAAIMGSMPYVTSIYPIVVLNAHPSYTR